MAEKFDVVVIGSGPGGYAAAIRCAQKNASVAIIEKRFIGGTCLNIGCVPSKTLLASAQTLLNIMQADQMGIGVTSITPNWQKIQQRKKQIVENFRDGLTSLLKTNKIKIIQGCAIVTAPGKIRIDSPTAPAEIEAEKIILATGSEPVELSSLPFDTQTIIASQQALSLPQIPKSMLVVGGGVIGCEIACMYTAMGTNVTIVEALPRLLPMEDEWVSRLINREFKKLGINTITNQKVISAEKIGSLTKVTLDNDKTLEAEKILVAVGRKPTIDEETIESLKLETVGYAIKVDEKMQTSAPNVYAIGDAVATTFLAHGAFAEAEVAAANVMGGNEKLSDYSLIPKAVYTFPEIASVGKNEQACKSEGLDISVGRSFFRANSRSAAHNEITGEVRVIKDNATNKIIGVTMVGAMVTELISAARTLIGTSKEITELSFPHPTVSEVLKEAAEDAFGLSLHNPPQP